MATSGFGWLNNYLRFYVRRLTLNSDTHNRGARRGEACRSRMPRRPYKTLRLNAVLFVSVWFGSVCVHCVCQQVGTTIGHVWTGFWGSGVCHRYRPSWVPGRILTGPAWRPSSWPWSRGSSSSRCPAWGSSWAGSWRSWRALWRTQRRANEDTQSSGPES